MAADLSPTPQPESLPSSGAGPAPLRKGLLRERFEGVKDVALEQAMDKGESWARKVGDGSQGVKLDDIPRMVAALGLKLVDARRTCITPEELAEYEACKTLARGRLAPPAPKLDEDWEPK